MISLSSSSVSQAGDPPAVRRLQQVRRDLGVADSGAAAEELAGVVGPVPGLRRVRKEPPPLGGQAPEVRRRAEQARRSGLSGARVGQPVEIRSDHDQSPALVGRWDVRNHPEAAVHPHRDAVFREHGPFRIEYEGVPKARNRDYGVILPSSAPPPFIRERKRDPTTKGKNDDRDDRKGEDGAGLRAGRR